MLTTLHRPMVSARPRPSRHATVVRANLLNDVGAGEQWQQRAVEGAAGWARPLPMSLIWNGPQHST